MVRQLLACPDAQQTGTDYRFTARHVYGQRNRLVYAHQPHRCRDCPCAQARRKGTGTDTGLGGTTCCRQRGGLGLSTMHRQHPARFPPRTLP